MQRKARMPLLPRESEACGIADSFPPQGIGRRDDRATLAEDCRVRVQTMSRSSPDDVVVTVLEHD